MMMKLVAFLLIIGLPGAVAPTDMYLKIGGVDGESTSTGGDHGKWIEVLSGTALHLDKTTCGNNGPYEGSLELHMRMNNKVSPVLLRSFSRGGNIRSCDLCLVDSSTRPDPAGDLSQCYFRAEMKDCSVAHYELRMQQGRVITDSDSDGIADDPVEIFVMQYRETDLHFLSRNGGPMFDENEESAEFNRLNCGSSSHFRSGHVP